METDELSIACKLETPKDSTREIRQCVESSHELPLKIPNHSRFAFFVKIYRFFQFLHRCWVELVIHFFNRRRMSSNTCSPSNSSTDPERTSSARRSASSAHAASISGSIGTSKLSMSMSIKAVR